ncbi:MAG: hypothetical protein HC822_09480 [Oscillochloris sp.]|nr:hypothetical protein [Oscillochloris sp.]
MTIITRRLAILLLIVSIAGPFAAPAQAQEESYGYLWQLEFDFAHDFNGLLTIHVGPWENGDLVEVDATSQERVACKRVGPVYLDSGDAVFNGGYLRCTMDLARIVANNHGLDIAPVDSYGSILMQSRLIANQTDVMPIFSHPDADYTIDFALTSAVTPAQTLWNGAGLLQHTFPGVVGMTWQTYTYEYRCAWLGACDAEFEVGPHSETKPTLGDRVQFHTGPQTFYIGYDGANTFSGRMDRVLIDPGNSVH